MTRKLYDDKRVLAALAAARDVDVDWAEIGPELAMLLQDTRRELIQWMTETSHASGIADTWRRRYLELSEHLEALNARHPLA